MIHKIVMIPVALSLRMYGHSRGISADGICGDCGHFAGDGDHECEAEPTDAADLAAAARTVAELAPEADDALDLALWAWGRREDDGEIRWVVTAEELWSLATIAMARREAA